MPGGTAEHLRPYWWKKGQSGNPNGRQRSRVYISDSYKKILGKAFAAGGDLTATLRKVLDDMLEDGATIADMLAFSQIHQAIAKGRTRAAAEITDRIEGKPRQTVSVTGPNEGPLQSIDFDPDKLSPEELRNLVDLLAKAQKDDPLPNPLTD